MTKKELAKKFDEYVDALQDLGTHSVIEEEKISIYFDTTIYISEGINEIIDALGIKEVETDPTILERWDEERKEMVKWFAKHKRFYYRDFKFTGIEYINRAEEL